MRGRGLRADGPESLSQTAQVHAIGNAIGRRLTFEELSPDEWRRQTAGTGPASVVEMLLGAWQATLGHPAYVTPAIQEITGSPARTVHQWALDHAEAFGRTAPSADSSLRSE